MPETRKLLPTEGPLLAAHLIRLSPDDRRHRFGGLFMPDDVLRRYADAIDWTHSWQIGRFDAGAPRAVVQLSVPRRTSDADIPWMRAGAAEFGVSVEKPWRRQGVATQLIRQMIAVARNRRVRDLYMLCQPENEPMRRLAKKIGLRLTYGEGEIIGHIPLPEPDLETVLAEGAINVAAAQPADRAEASARSLR